jgi:hypothetical protein
VSLRDDLETIIQGAGWTPPPSDDEILAAARRLRVALTPEVCAVIEELGRQVQKWGGPAHDDKHSPNDWHALIRDYNGWARAMASMGSLEKAERRWIQVAALALSAAASARRHRTAEPELARTCSEVDETAEPPKFGSAPEARFQEGRAQGAMEERERIVALLCKGARYALYERAGRESGLLVFEDAIRTALEARK